MKIALFSTIALLAGGVTLTTDYTKERTLTIETKIHVTNETTERTRDGEPMDLPGHPKSENTWHIVQTDTVNAHEGNKPTKVKRHYETVGGESVFSMGDQEPRENELKSPFEGTTLQLSGDGDEVKVEFLEGSKPDHEGALEGHRLALGLDALLPDGEVEKDAKWELDSDQVKRALGTGLFKALYPPPQRDDNAGGGAGGGGGRRGGGMMGRGGGSGLVGMAEWKGKAKLVALDEEVDGQKCAKVELELSAKGDLPEPQMGGRGRRPGVFEPESAALVSNTYTIEATGTFYFSIQGKHPVRLELEGTTGTETEREMRRRDEDTTSKMHTRSEGKLTVKIEVSQEAAEKK